MASRLLPVTVVVIPVPSGPVRRVDLDRAIDDCERRGDERVRGRPDAEPYKLQKAGIDNGPFVVGAAAEIVAVDALEFIASGDIVG